MTQEDMAYFVYKNEWIEYYVKVSGDSSADCLNMYMLMVLKFFMCLDA